MQVWHPRGVRSHQGGDLDSDAAHLDPAAPHLDARLDGGHGAPADARGRL